MIRGSFRAIVSDVEVSLCEFYGVGDSPVAADHIIAKQDVVDSGLLLASEIGRAAVVVAPETKDNHAYIGITFDVEIEERLLKQDPNVLLDNQNLDAFCVVIEELSHFHLLTQRMASNRTTTRLELECQGEIDKVLVSAKLLAKQCGDPHIMPLVRAIFDGAQITSSDMTLYWEATRYAARFWFDALRLIGDRGERAMLDDCQFIKYCRHLYAMPWEVKAGIIDSPQIMRNILNRRAA